MTGFDPGEQGKFRPSSTGRQSSEATRLPERSFAALVRRKLARAASLPMETNVESKQPGSCISQYEGEKQRSIQCSFSRPIRGTDNPVPDTRNFSRVSKINF